MLAHTEAIKGINTMKLYHIEENLSMVLAVILCGDAYGCLYLFGEHLIYGTPITGWLLLPVVILAAFAVAALVCVAVRMIRKIRRYRLCDVKSARLPVFPRSGKRTLRRSRRSRRKRCLPFDSVCIGAEVIRAIYTA